MARARRLLILVTLIDDDGEWKDDSKYGVPKKNHKQLRERLVSNLLTYI